MARLQGISGGMSGKTGSFTFRQSGGQTIVSQYQPVVKNPNTEGQQSQRAKFKLLSQLAAVMAPGFGTMSVLNRPGRVKPSKKNGFMQINSQLVEVDTDENNAIIAKIPMDEVKLTTSTRYLGSLEKEGSNVKCTISDDTIESIRFVVVGYVNNDITRPVIEGLAMVPVENGGASVSVAAGKHTVLAYGVIPTSSASTATLDNLHTPSNEDFFSAVKLETLVSSGQIVETQTIGINVTME